jgi:peptidoglycan glycosyltransferase
MSRRIGVIGIVMVLLFGIIAVQSGYLQFARAAKLDASPLNPRNVSASQYYARGDIIAADGTVLAYSTPSGNAQYPWKRVYPLGSLTSGVVGFSSNFYAQWALEAQFDPYLQAHKQPAESAVQVISPTVAADSVDITLEPALQKVAQTALDGRDGAVVALDPKNGNVLAMYSNPTFDPKFITDPGQASEAAAWKLYNTPDPHNFPPLGLVATQETFPPGSTFKVVTTAAVVRDKAYLLQKSYPSHVCVTLPTTNNHQLCNDGYTTCGGVIAVMLPESCDPGFALVGLDVGGQDLSSVAHLFGYSSNIPIDLPGVVESYFPPAKVFTTDIPQLMFSAIGQENVRATALQNALVAAAIADHGTIMVPHFLSRVVGPNGVVIQHYASKVWRRPLSVKEADEIVPFMRGVVQDGTASGVGFLAADDVAAKTGTAQTGTAVEHTDDWMIAFAPAADPVVAVAVVVPFQATSDTGAIVAGPVMKCVIEAALAIYNHQPASGTATTCAP